MFRYNNIESYIQNWKDSNRYYLDDGTIECRSEKPCQLNLEIVSRLRIADISLLWESYNLMPEDIDDMSDNHARFNFKTASGALRDYSDYFKNSFKRGNTSSFYNKEIKKNVPMLSLCESKKKTLLEASRNKYKFINHWYGTPEHPQSSLL